MRDYNSQLALKYLVFPQEELQKSSGEKDVWAAHGEEIFPLVKTLVATPVLLVLLKKRKKTTLGVVGK